MILHVDQKHVLSATGNLYVDFVNNEDIKIRYS